MGMKKLFGKFKDLWGWFKPLLKRKSFWYVLLAAVVVGSLGTYGFKKHQKEKKAKELDEESTVVKLKKGDLELEFKEIGDIAAKNYVDVAPKVSGRVTKLFVQEGDVVKEGEKLAVIQPGKTGAEKFLPSTVLSPIPGVVLSSVKKNQNQPYFAQMSDYVTGLFDSGNPTYIMAIADMRTVIVELKINEIDILKLKQGMPVTVEVDALKDEEFPAKVTMISPRAEKEQRGGKIFRVEVALDKSDPRLRTGMTARVTAELEKKEGVLKMPLSGLFEEKECTMAYLYKGKEEKPKQVEIDTGMRTEIDVEIEGGLKEGDKVITEKPVEFEELPEDSPCKTGEKKKKKNGKKLTARQKKKAARASRRKARKARKGSRAR